MPARARLTALAGAVVAAMAVAGVVLLPARPTQAADHLDPPARTDPDVDQTPDKAADIADVYAWHTPTSLIVAMTFAGPQSPTLPGIYDRDVLYTINISNAGAATDAEFPIDIRFGHDGASTGVRISGVPGAPGPIVGPVETNLASGPVMARAGVFDDPFFFDLQGFRQTRSTGVLSFNGQRDFFRGLNDTVVVLEMPRTAVENGSNVIHIWATSARLGGQI
jgi:Domain of unknown function (DUF4331)